MKLWLAAALCAAALALVASAFAAGRPVSPAAGATARSPYVTFTWTVPDGETVTDLQIFVDKSLQHEADDVQLKPGQTSAAYRYPLEAGTYYWQLSGLDANQQSAYSGGRKLVVAPYARFTRIRLSTFLDPANGKPATGFGVRVLCNIDQPVEPTLTVFRGSQVLYRSPFSPAQCAGMHAAVLGGSWDSSVPHGTKLFVQWSIAYKGFTAKSARTPFSAH